MFVGESDLTNEWTPLTDLCEVTAGDMYVIANASTENVYAVEQSAAPEEGINGVPIAPGNYLAYVKESEDLYLRNGQSVTIRGGVPVATKASRVVIHKVG